MVLLAVVRQTTSPRTYQAFELFSLHGLSGAEVARLTGLSRNAVYQARKEVLRRLAELGAAYRDDGRLDARVKRALASGGIGWHVPEPERRASADCRTRHALRRATRRDRSSALNTS